MELLQIPIDDLMQFEIVLGNEEAVKGRGVCEKILLDAQGAD